MTPEANRDVIRSYEDLHVYERAMALLKPVHKLALQLPDFEKYDLANQLRRASKSVPANIAEGYAKKRSLKEFRAFLANAMGSSSEMVVHLKIARELEYVRDDDSAKLMEEYDILGKQLNRLISRWRSLDEIQPPTSNLRETSS